MAYFWYQIAGGEDAWHEALSEHREQIIQQRRPAFVTVLDAYSSPDETWGREDYAKMKYSGPLYFDWDSDDINETIPQFQKFLVNLQEMGVNLYSLRLYATGGRGFHLEIPPTVFMPKVAKGGVTALPYAYREMAMEMVVDTLDMRVYTGRKGRMWRTPGIERSNGKFKVPISVADALGMTSDLYDTLCSAPLHEPQRELPELNMALAAMFVKAQSKVEESLKRRAKGNVDEALLAKFKGKYPPTVQKLMAGEGVLPGVGFHKIAMQLAITANALGKTSDDLVEACQGLCSSHESDSPRYNSPRKRKEELRRMWEYTHDNPCYGYSRGGIRSLCDADLPTSDLDGVSESVGIGQVPDGDEDAISPEMANEIEASNHTLVEGLLITRSGIHKRTAEGARMISNISMRKPTVLIDPDDHKTLGFEVDILSDGDSMGRHGVTQKTFSSRATLSAFCGEFGGIFSGSDTQAGVVQLMLSRAAKKGERVVYALHKEGLDLVQNPLIKDRSVKDVVWVHPDSVETWNSEAKYKFQPGLAASPIFYADAHRSEVLTSSPDAVEWLRALMDINNPTTVAQMLGWFVSCFHRQFYHQTHTQFPLLHPNGPAGAGKTLTTLLLSRMFYLTTNPVLRSCAPSTTAFTLKAAFSGSASVPLILDEYKPTELGVQRTDMLRQAFRDAYNQSTGSTGGVTRGNSNGSFRELTDFTYSTPLAYLGETQEMQTAIVQRSLPVSFIPDEAKAHTASFDLAQRGVDFLPRLGKNLLRQTMVETLESRREAIDLLRVQLRAQVDEGVVERQVFNLAVVLEGLNFLGRVLADKQYGFGDALAPDLDRLKQSIWDHKSEISVSAMTEAAKMVNDLSLISRTEESESEFSLREGFEYITRDGYVEVLMRETFVKYFAWCKRKGLTPYYTNVDSFMSAMGKFPATMDVRCFGSPLKTSGQARVFRFSCEKLAAEGVEMFKTKHS